MYICKSQQAGYLLITDPYLTRLVLGFSFDMCTIIMAKTTGGNGCMDQKCAGSVSWLAANGWRLVARGDDSSAIDEQICAFS